MDIFEKDERKEDGVPGRESDDDDRLLNFRKGRDKDGRECFLLSVLDVLKLDAESVLKSVTESSDSSGVGGSSFLARASSESVGVDGAIERLLM